MTQTKLNLLELSLVYSKKGSRFEARSKEFGVQLGLFGLGAALYEVPPGKTADAFHRHHTADEMFLVLSGTGTYRYGDVRLPIAQWDCLAAPAAGEGHQIINTGKEPLRYLAFSNNTNADVCEYPDSGRVDINVGPTGHHRENATFSVGGTLVPTPFLEGEQID